MATRSRQGTRRGGAVGVTALGVALAAGAVAYGIHGLRVEGVQFVYPAVETLLLLGLAGTVTATGGVLHRSDLEDGDCWRIASWVGLGIIATVGLSLWQLSTQVRGGATLRDPLLTLVVTQTVGATLGLLVGSYHVRALRNARIAGSATAEAGTRSDQLSFVHTLLRHNLFNGMQVIQSYTRRLSPHVEPVGQPHLETIQRRSDRLVTLVENMQPIARSMDDSDDLGSVDLVETIEREAGHFETTYHGTTVEVGSDRESTPVRADSLLSAVVENLLRCAIERSGVSGPTVEVTVRTDGSTCECRIESPGPAVDRGVARQFLTSAQSELGDADLYIARELVTRYDGSLTVDDGASGPAFTLRLPLASGDV